MALTLSQIVEAKLPLRAVECPEWGGVIYVRSLDVGTYLDLMPRLQGEAGDVSAQIVAACACDEDGHPLFDGTDLIQRLHAGAVLRVAKAAVDLNSLAASIEDEAKN